MDQESSSEDQDRLRAAVEASRAAAKEVAKDAAGLSRQSAVLKARAAETRLEAQEARAQARQARSPLPPDVLLTIPETASRLHVAERTLRHVLSEPGLQAQLIERTRKVGIYYKFIPLVSTDLLADLIARFAENRTHSSRDDDDGN